ncbi:MAG TPA: hypothetical protein VIW94_04275 [Acidimicrobiia bacterium]
MSKLLILLVVVLAACSSGTAATTTSDVTVPTSETTTTISPTPTTAPPVDCPAAPYELTVLPAGVGQGILDPDEIEPDVWTSVGATNTTIWGRSDGTVAVALIRGTLPAVDWPGDKGEVLIDGTRAAVGPHTDGTWVVGWFEEPGERCDWYTMVFYAPVAPSDVEATLVAMKRVPG